MQKKTVDGSVCVCVFGFDLGGCTPLGVYVGRCMCVCVYVHAHTLLGEAEDEAGSHGG